MQVGGTQAVCSIPATYGKVDAADAKEMLEWLELIARRLRRDIRDEEASHPAPFTKPFTSARSGMGVPKS